MIRQDIAVTWKETGKAPSGLEANRSFVLSEDRFQNMLWRESKRSERSGKHVLLMLVDHGRSCEQPKACRPLLHAAGALGSIIRDTDIAGWFDSNCVLGVIFTEFGDSGVNLASEAIEAKVTASLRKALSTHQLSDIHISFYAFPEGVSWSGRTAGRVRHQVVEPQTRSNDLLVACDSALQLRARVAELCSPSRRLRLD
jgi:hypothetical protein